MGSLYSHPTSQNAKHNGQCVRIVFFLERLLDIPPNFMGGRSNMTRECSVLPFLLCEKSFMMIGWMGC
jgi:hypothetical protein